MAITTLDGLVAGCLATPFPYIKVGFSPQAISSYTALWTKVGNPGAGANSSSGVAGDVPTNATAGAIGFSNPGSGNTYLARLGAVGLGTAGALLLYDRLWQNSGLSPTSLVAQTVNSVALTRPSANGDTAEAWFQVYGVLGAGSTGSTISYTNQAGTASKTGTLQGFATTAAADRCFLYSLATGDNGVRSIQSYTNGATMTSGTFGLIIRRMIATMPIVVANTGITLDGIGLGLPRIYDSACLEFLWAASSTSASSAHVTLSLAQG